MHVEIVERPSLRVGAVRHLGPYAAISQAFGRLTTLAGQAGLLQRSGAEMIALYYDDPRTTDPEALRSDAGITVAHDVKLPRDLTEQRVPGGRYARVLHIGPYEELGRVWDALIGEWLPAHGHRQARGPSYEVYRNTPATTPREKLRTEVYVPLTNS